MKLALTDYQFAQILQMIVCLAVVAVFYAYVRLVRGGAWPPVVGVGAIVAVGAAVTFALSSLAAGLEGWERLQVAAKLLRELPVACALSYVCLLQARRYRGVRDAGKLRAWFEKAPYFLMSAFGASILVAALFPFAVFDTNGALPPRALMVDSLLMVPFAAYAGIASFVFLRAASPEVLVLGRRLQNWFAAVGAGAMSPIAANTLLADAVRVFGAPAQISWWMPKLLAAQQVAIPVEVLGLAGALVCHYTRSEHAKFTERFLDFVGLVNDLTDVVENAPISKAKLNLQYASLLQATTKEFLDLPKEERRMAEDAFRGVVILKYRRGAAGRGGAGLRVRLLHLAEAYHEEMRNPVLREQLMEAKSSQTIAAGQAPALSALSRRTEDPEESERAGPSDMHEVLRFILGLVDGAEEQEKGRPLLTDASPCWVQLCCVALADTELLAPSWRRMVLDDGKVSQRAKDAYSLAKFKMSSYRTSSGDVFDH